MAKDPGFSLEINLTKTKWTPKLVEEIPRAVSFAFEKEVTIESISPIVGTDHIKSWPLNNEDDIKEFLAAPSMMQEAFAEKLIKFRHPGGLMPKKWMPKKVKILARGNLISKFFGEDEVGTRNLETSLKIFDCGHFYLKQTLPGSGPTPYWTIFEGVWQKKDTGIRLQYHIRYSWQTSIKAEKDVSIEAQPPGLETSLAWVGETESALNGTIPAIVGEDKFCRVEICREPDKVGKATTRWNEDLPDWSFSRKEGEADDAATSVPSSSEGLRRRPQAEQPPQPRTEPGSSASSSSCPSVAQPPAQRAAPSPVPPSAAHAGGATGGTAAPRPQPAKPTSDSDDVEEDTEPMWPLLVGLAFFVLLLGVMGWFWWEERRRQAELENAW